MTATMVTNERGFRHEALLYAGIDQFVARTTPFITGALEADEPILVVVSRQKIAALRTAVGKDADRVQFRDMSEVGANPARIIPAWHTFVEAHAGEGRRLRGIGEPIYPERTASELVESQRHEALLNAAFDGEPDFWLLCPYNTQALDPSVVETAHRTHPVIADGHGTSWSDLYPGVAASVAPYDKPLPEPSALRATLAFDAKRLSAVRRLVSREAASAGFMTRSIADLVLAANEVATNSVQHGGAAGTLRIWRDGGVLVCEVRDRGHFEDPLADRRRPAPGQDGGRGLWLANQLCDLVQIRSCSSGTTVRLHMHRDRSR
ncbi:MAG TPA: sensor histidine kinase [Candidatus Acidoferrum sp.]|nr:sensor histidine kinase [Candidatus Acidoferrum sp.]